MPKTALSVGCRRLRSRSDAEDCALGRSSLTDQAGGSQCLVGGAEGIRTAGPLCGFWRLSKGSKFQRGRCAKADQRIVLREISRQILVENGRTSAPFQAGKGQRGPAV